LAAAQPVAAERVGIAERPNRVIRVAAGEHRDSFARMPSRDDSVRIALPPDFDFDWVLGFLAARTVASLEAVRERAYRRSVRVNGKPVTLTLTEIARNASVGEGRAQHLLIASARPRLQAATLEAAVRRMLDLDVDLGHFHRLARRDPILAPIVRRRSGIRLPQLLDPFEGLTRAILGQQVSVAGASTITDRLVRLFSRPVRGASNSGFLAFPTPADVAEAGSDRLRELGLTRTRAATLHGAARRIADGALDLERLRTLPADEAQAALEELPGIGPWTASYVRMRALGDRDAFPSADLGVIKRMEAAGVARQSILDVAERWRPWRGYVTLHLWASAADRR
jgi:AraC family transcriptional regulator, regulatory protein of adaptative response / DNA-3-methyladenine glycosylase II